MTERSRVWPQVGVCTDWPVPATLQLAGQLHWAVAQGQAQPGTALPTVERMAAAVGLNRNTVNAVYSSAARAGLLELRRGAGTRVAAGRADQAPLLPLIEALFDSAATLGFSAWDTVFLTVAKGALIEQGQRQRPQVGLLATPGCDVSGQAAALAAALGYGVETATLADAEGRLAGAPARWPVTVVRAGAVLPGPGLTLLDWVAAPGVTAALGGLPPGAPVATVAATAGAAQSMRRALVSAGFGRLRIFSGTPDDGPLLAALPHMVRIRADAATAALLRQRQPGLDVRPFDWELTAASREALRQACRLAAHRAPTAGAAPVSAGRPG